MRGGVAALVIASLMVAGCRSRTVPPLPPPPQADSILVIKHQRQLFLMRGGSVWKSYRIALGRDPQGHKQREGDGRTPEGRYVIDWRNPNSRFHRSLHISYPDPADQEHSDTAAVAAGGDIMIHGLPNGSWWLGELHAERDWTDGCIAVTDAEMDEIWESVADGTVIEILP